MSTLTTAPATFKVGDLVTVTDPSLFSGNVAGVVYEVEKAPRTARETNYVVRPHGSPAGRGLKAPGYAFKAHDPAAPVVTVEDIPPYVPVPGMGVLVTVTGVPKIDPADLFVSMGEARKAGCAKLVKVGGDNGRYWPAIPATKLTVVDPATLTWQ